MDSTRQPNKEQVREWLVKRRESRMPPPGIEEIRIQLGWLRGNDRTKNASRKA